MEVSSSFKLRRIRDIFNGEIDEEDSFFDLVLESPSCCATKKDFVYMESPMDDFLGTPKLISPVTPLLSTPKYKVFTLSFKKRSKSKKTESNSELKATATPLRQFLKLSSVSSKCSRAGELPVASVFVNDNSLRSQMLKESSDFQVPSEKSIAKYLKLIRPFYTKASKKAKAKVTVVSTPSCSPAVNLSQRKFSEEGRIGSFKIVARKLVRSRSTSAAIGMPPLQRRDDMLMEQQDGIQAAILHCKKSYFASCDEQKRFSI